MFQATLLIPLGIVCAVAATFGPRPLGVGSVRTETFWFCGPKSNQLLPTPVYVTVTLGEVIYYHNATCECVLYVNSGEATVYLEFLKETRSTAPSRLHSVCSNYEVSVG